MSEGDGLCIGWTSRREFRNNLPCRAKAMKGSQYCARHDPARREAREAEARQARLDTAQRHADAQRAAGGEWACVCTSCRVARFSGFVPVERE